MTNLRRQLREADPVRVEGGLSVVEAARIRAVVVAAPSRDTATSWIPFAAIAAGLVAAVAAGIWSVGRVPSSSALRSVATLESNGGSEEPGTRRQIYFSTPGGTRVIWQFNRTFELR